MHSSSKKCHRFLAGFLLTCGYCFSFFVPSVHADWESSQFEEASGHRHHVAVTGTAEGWAGMHGHPKLRVSCDASPGGGDLFIGFHFPAQHDFLAQHSRNEPVQFRVTGPERERLQQQIVEYLSVPAFEQSVSDQSVLRTMLASDGIASTRQSGKLLLDLHHGRYLDVRFIQHSQAYNVQYSLVGYSEHVSKVMDACQLTSFSSDDLHTTWEDYIKLIEVAGVLSVQPPVVGAAQPSVNKASYPAARANVQPQNTLPEM